MQVNRAWCQLVNPFTVSPFLAPADWSSIMKAVSVEEAVAMIPNGASIMVGGFMGVGTPERLLDELVRQKKSRPFPHLQ